MSVSCDPGNYAKFELFCHFGKMAPTSYSTVEILDFLDPLATQD